MCWHFEKSSKNNFFQIIFNILAHCWCELSFATQWLDICCAIWLFKVNSEQRLQSDYFGIKSIYYSHLHGNFFELAVLFIGWKVWCVVPKTCSNFMYFVCVSKWSSTLKWMSLFCIETAAALCTKSRQTLATKVLFRFYFLRQRLSFAHLSSTKWMRENNNESYFCAKVWP